MKLRLFEKALLRNPFRRYLQKHFEAPRLFRGIPSLRGGICLELGSGYGHGAELIREHTGCRRVVATDLDIAMARQANKRVGIDVVIADATQLPFRDESFDGVSHFFVYDHIPEWRTAIREVFRVLKPGGVYACEEELIPDRPWLMNPVFGHVVISGEEFRAALIETGFTVRRFEQGKLISPLFVQAWKEES